MRTPRRMPVVLAAACGLAGAVTGVLPAAASASAGPARAPRPGQWTQVTSPLTNIADVGLARGADGVLHVTWTSGSTGSYRLADTPIQPNGVAGQPVTIESRIFSASDPDATVTAAGLAVFWNAVRSSSPSSQVGTFEATRPPRGGSWQVTGFTTTPDSWGPTVAAAPGTGSNPWVAFSNGGGIGVDHVGQPGRELRYPVCCVTEEGLGTDSKTGTTWVTYVSQIPGHGGLFAQRLTSSGQRSGSPVELPASNAGSGALVVNQRITATGLGGGRPGVYVTYRTGGGGTADHLQLIELGARTPVTLASFTRTDEIGGSTLAADPFGRLWVAWFRVIDNRPVLFVRRAKSGAGQFGQAKQVALPPGTLAIDKIYLNAQARKVDVLALVSLHGKTSYWTTQVLPPGSRPSPARTPAQSTSAAGRAVPGAGWPPLI